MKQLYNKIKPVGKRAIVSIDINSKGKHTIKNEKGEDLELYIAHDFSWDGKESNFTQGLLLTDYKNLKAGTNVLIHHNAIIDENRLDIDSVPPHIHIHSIEDMFLFFGFKDGEYLCIDDIMLAERLYDEDTVSSGGIILTEKKKHDSLLKIVAKPDNITDYEVGDVAVVYKYSDYEMIHSLGGKQTRIIRLRYKDCLGKMN